MFNWGNHLQSLRRLIAENRIKVRFVMVGVLNTIFGLAVFPTLYFLMAPLRLHYLGVLSISQIICVTFSFVTTKYLVFRTSGNHVNEYAKFASFHFIYFLVNLAVLPLMVEGLFMSPIWAQLLFSITVIVSSYFWHSRVSFAQQGNTR